MKKKILKYSIFSVLALLVIGIVFAIYYFFVKQNYFGKTSFFDEHKTSSGTLVSHLVDGSGNTIELNLGPDGMPVDAATGTLNTGNDNNYDQETLGWIEKLKSKAKKISGNTTAPKPDTKVVKLDPKESVEFVRGLEKQPFNIKGYYFGIVYGLGMENEWGDKTTDSIKIFVYNENTGKLLIFGLPRDWQIDYEGKKMKIDFLYNEIFYNKVKQDQAKALEMTTNYISNMLDIPLNYYVMIDFDAFKEFVDEIGGIDVCVDKNLKWEGKLLLEKGCYTLDGDLALKVSRTRKQDNDFFRIFRQNSVIYSIMQKVQDVGLVKIFKLAQIYIKRVHTNLNMGEIIYILDHFGSVSDKKQIILNSECNFYKGQFGMDFCFFYNAKEDYFLKQFVDTSVINHYIKTLIMYPDLYGCEISGQGTYLQKLNLANVGMKFNTKTFKLNDEFTINTLSGCDEKGVNYFLNLGN